MAITNSKKLYEDAVRWRQQFNRSQPSYCSQYQGYNQYSIDDLEKISEEKYVRIIEAMFYELIMDKNSDLLSALCSSNNIRYDFTNFNIQRQGYLMKNAFDLVPFVHGLQSAFTKKLDDCGYLFSSRYKNDVFQGKTMPKEDNIIGATIEALKKIDEHIGRLLPSPAQSSKEASSQDRTKAEKTKEPEPILRIHDPELIARVNQLAEARKETDSALLEQIQQLQMPLQDELKQVQGALKHIMELREGVEYKITEEAIRQFISLYHLVSDVFQCHHPDDEDKESYRNLVDSCEDFLANIEQSLGLLGVAIIDDKGKPFEPAKHKTARGTQPERNRIIANVVKMGFSYKDKVLERAEVELAN